jgi:hypothetical protein
LNLATSPKFTNLSDESIILANTLNYLPNAKYRAIEFYAAVPGPIDFQVYNFFNFINYLIATIILS